MTGLVNGVSAALGLRQQRFDPLPNGGLHYFQRPGRVNHTYAPRLSGGNGFVAMLNPLKEAAVGLFHSVAQRLVKRQFRVTLRLFGTNWHVE